MEIPTNYLYPLQASMEQWDDTRIIGPTDLESMLLFWLYMPNVLSQNGLQYRGAIFRQKEQQTLLTVKVVESGTPLVVFITSNNSTGCMVRFWNLFEDDKLSWVRDRYPWN